jgi:hypothetical protein
VNYIFFKFSENTKHVKGGCKLRATGLEDFLDEHALHEVHVFNGCFDPQRDL